MLNAEVQSIKKNAAISRKYIKISWYVHRQWFNQKSWKNLKVKVNAKIIYWNFEALDWEGYQALSYKVMPLGLLRINGIHLALKYLI